jgi:hypothetical protein
MASALVFKAGAVKQFTVQYTISGTAQTITSPTFQIRETREPGSTLIAEFAVSGTGTKGVITGSGTTTLTFTMSAANTLLLAAASVKRSGFFDGFGTVGGNIVCIASGEYTLVPNVTV